MWGKQNKVWIQYRDNIIAHDVSTAIFLSSFLRHTNIHKTYVKTYEVVDLQRYKHIKQHRKVRASMNDNKGIPFVFPVNLN